MTRINRILAPEVVNALRQKLRALEDYRVHIGAKGKTSVPPDLIRTGLADPRQNVLLLRNSEESTLTGVITYNAARQTAKAKKYSRAHVPVANFELFKVDDSIKTTIPGLEIAKKASLRPYGHYTVFLESGIVRPKNRQLPEFIPQGWIKSLGTLLDELRRLSRIDTRSLVSSFDDEYGCLGAPPPSSMKKLA